MSAFPKEMFTWPNKGGPTPGFPLSSYAEQKGPVVPKVRKEKLEAKLKAAADSAAAAGPGKKLNFGGRRMTTRRRRIHKISRRKSRCNYRR